jgi:Protein of unknown function (DUF1203)
MTYRITGLNPERLLPLFALDEESLRRAGAQRVRVTAKPAAPCRITLTDAEIGEEVILMSYEHQPAATPYRQQGPIFVRESSARCEIEDALPPALAIRPLSLRAFDAAGMMVDADLAQGAEAEALIQRFLAKGNVSTIHAHYARRGCYAARIDRA